MQINELKIKQLRNHFNSVFYFEPGINLLYGLNGVGKTTILEAISICALTKSFLPVNDMNLIMYGKDYYKCELNAVSDLESPYKISITFPKNKKKQIFSNQGDNLNPKDVIGDLPLIVLSPDYKSITFGSPSDRREFLDKILSQSSVRYMANILKMRKSIRQRNFIIQKVKKTGYLDKTALDSWTDVFIDSAAQVIAGRKQFIEDFLPYFLKYYQLMSNSAETVNIEYKPDHIPEEILKSENLTKDISKHLRSVYDDIIDSELKRGTSLFGPQKDEILFLIDKGIAKEAASQGQHKSLLISLKFAEFEFLKEKKNETPVVLLDDIFSELDEERVGKVLDLLTANEAQTFITSTSGSIIKSDDYSKKIKYFKIFAQK